MPLQQLYTYLGAERGAIEDIEANYSRRRPHSTIGYQIPANAMESFFERTKLDSKAPPAVT